MHELDPTLYTIEHIKPSDHGPDQAALGRPADKPPSASPPQAAPLRRLERGSDRDGRRRARGLAALAGEAGKVAHAPRGTRNAALNVSSLKCAHFIAAGDLDRTEVTDRLIGASEANG